MAGNLCLINAVANTISVKANAAVTAGAFVKCVSSDDVVTSSASAGALSDFVVDDILIEEADASGDENLVIGICGQDASAGVSPVLVYTQGLFMVRAGGAITAGHPVQKSDSSDPYECDDLATINNNSEEDEWIGKALTGTSAADKYFILLLNIK